MSVKRTFFLGAVGCLVCLGGMGLIAFYGLAVLVTEMPKRERPVIDPSQMASPATCSEYAGAGDSWPAGSSVSVVRDRKKDCTWMPATTASELLTHFERVSTRYRDALVWTDGTPTVPSGLIQAWRISCGCPDSDALAETDLFLVEGHDALLMAIEVDNGEVGMKWTWDRSHGVKDSLQAVEDSGDGLWRADWKDRTQDRAAYTSVFSDGDQDLIWGSYETTGTGGHGYFMEIDGPTLKRYKAAIKAKYPDAGPTP